MIPTLDHKEWLTIIGWVVTFVLGSISGALIVPRFTRKRQILTWAIMNEAELIPRDLSEKLSIPVVVKVGDQSPTSLTSLTLRIGNSGNETISAAAMAIMANSDANILDVRFASDVGEYANHVKWVKNGRRCDVTATFINQNQQFDLEFLIGGYELGSMEVDAAMASVEVKKVAASNWDTVLGSASNPVLLTFLAVLPGLKFSAVSDEVRSNAMINEIRALRKAITRQNTLPPAPSAPAKVED